MRLLTFDGKQRRSILKERGHNHKLIDRLLAHAKLWAELRHTLRLQVDNSRDFNKRYCARFLEQPDPGLQATVEHLERSVKVRIDSLDKTLQDLIQIVRPADTLPAVWSD